MHFLKIIPWAVLSTIPLIGGNSAFALSEAEEKGDSLNLLLGLSLQELGDIKVSTPAALTSLSQQELPAAVTVITAEDIALTPARNIYDLLEVYVPGAIWMNHEEGPHPGFRGSISNRNNKFLLLVNGRVMNSKGHYGAKSELEQWNMADIKRIEVVRGPGSVTYGPGAVAGIVSIQTHDALSLNENDVSVSYVDPYNSRGINIRQRYSKDDVHWFGTASITRTKGYKDIKQFQANKNPIEAGYIGRDIDADLKPLDYFADYQDTPQIKLHSEWLLGKHWDIWLRYTQQGATWHGNEAKTEFDGQLLNQQSTRDRHWIVAAEFRKSLGQGINVQSAITLDSFDAERRGGSRRNDDPDHPLNFNSNYSETELFLRGLVNWQYSNSMEIAVGGEFSRDYFSTGWGDSRSEMRLGSDGNVVSGDDSFYVPERLDPEEAAYAGKGWYTSTYSLLGEANIQFLNNYKILISARADKHSFTDWLFSPRLSLIANWRQDHVWKMTMQKSSRMNTAEELFSEDLNNIQSEEESLTSVELGYSGKFNQSLLVDIHTFYNDINILDWNNSVLLDTTERIGDLTLAGFEAEFRYSWKKNLFGINYSLIKQLDWELMPNVSNSGISYSDVRVNLGEDPDLLMVGEGNDLNNWPNQALKIFVNTQLSPKVSFHLNALALWDYQGAKDGLIAQEKAVEGSSQEAEVDAAIRKARDKGAYDLGFRLNASVSYQYRENLSLSLYLHNLLSHNDNKRYSYDTGNDDISPRHVRFVEEPRAIGLQLQYQY